MSTRYERGEAIPADAEVIFVGTPGGNTGDRLIEEGCLRFLETLDMGVWVCDGSLRAASEAGDVGYLAASLGRFTGIVVFAGGGNIGIYPDNGRLRASIFDAAPRARSFLVFPQSCIAPETPLLSDRVTVWAREAVSHDILQGAGVDTALVPDAAFLTAGDFTPRPDGEGTMWILRAPGRDLERVEHEVTVDGQASDPTYDRPLAEVVDSISPYRWVVSDRLHGAIISLLMGKRTALLPVAYHKNRAVYDTWLAEDPGIGFVTSDADLVGFRDSATEPHLAVADRAWEVTRVEFRRFLDRSTATWAHGGAEHAVGSPSRASTRSGRAEAMRIGMPRREPGEAGLVRLSADLEAPDGSWTVWFSAPEEVVQAEPLADAFALAALQPAMVLGLPMVCDAPLSAALGRNLVGLTELYSSWFDEYDPITVVAEPADPPIARGEARGAFFSGGVDSFHSVITLRSEIDTLIYVDGLDMLDPEPSFRADVRSRMIDAGEDMNLPVIVADSNVRAFSEAFGIWWAGAYHTTALGAIGHALGGGVGQALIAADRTYAAAGPWGNHPLTTSLFSSERVRLVPTGWEVSKARRVTAIASSPAALRHLRVCWENPDSAYNCGRCEKCLRVKMMLALEGCLEQCDTLDASLDVDAYEALDLTPLHLSFIEPILTRAVEVGHGDIADMLRRVVARLERESRILEANTSVEALLGTGDDAGDLVTEHRDTLYAALAAHHGRWLIARVLRDLPGRVARRMGSALRRFTRRR